VKFEEAFSTLERRKKELHILSWGLLVCNLEEVFLKVASDEEALTDGETSTGFAANALVDGKSVDLMTNPTPQSKSRVDGEMANMSAAMSGRDMHESFATNSSSPYATM
jgi:hypothetical protein